MEPLRASSAKLSKDQTYISTTADSVIGKEAPCVPASTACAVYKDYLHTNQLNTKPGRRFDEFFDPNIGYTNDVADADTEAVSVTYTLVHLHTCILLCTVLF